MLFFIRSNELTAGFRVVHCWLDSYISQFENFMNILVSSTRQWNPGDEFILIGVRNLLQEALKGHRINWILYDRNPDLFIDILNNPVHKERIWGNSFHHGDPQCLDLALIAGTPEWMGLPLKEFYKVVREGNLPLIMLGVGYIDAPITFSEDELYSFHHLLKVVTVRDEYAFRAFKEIGINPEILPCPALFASLNETAPSEIKKIGFVIQTSKTVNQSVSEELSHASAYMVKRLRNIEFEVDVVCHYIDEFVEFARTLSPVRYSYDARDYIDILSDFDLIISTRLHGAILANSLGRPAMMLNSDDPRCRGTVSQFPFIYTSSPDTIIDDVSTFKREDLDEIVRWKAQIKDRYLSLLKKVLGGEVQ